MDDRLRETLSAMMDDEADELSVRRLLSHTDQSEVRAQWQRWQQVRDVMHEGHGPGDAHGHDISNRVRKTLEGESVPGRNPTAGSWARSGTIRWHWPAVASVALALVVGFGVGTGLEDSPEAGLATEQASAAGQDMAAAGESEPVPELANQGLDEAQMEQVSRYLLRHAQHNSVAAGRGSVGYARAVSASGPAYR